MGFKRDTDHHEEQNGAHNAVDDNSQQQTAEGPQQLRRAQQKKCKSPAAKARCQQRLRARRFRLRIYALVIALILALTLRSFLMKEPQEYSQMRVLVIPDVAVSSDSRYHNLTAVAHALAHYTWLDVTLGDSSMYTEEMCPENILLNFKKYDAMLVQGASATVLADYAAYANVSVVRFVGVRELGVNDEIPPLSERPDVIVLGSNSGVSGANLPKEPGLWFNPHLELPVGMVDDYRANHYRKFVQRIWPLCRAGQQMKDYQARKAEITKDTMGLVIIANNEALRIQDPLLSMKDHIDAWTVLDTASTDNTSAVVTQLMQGKPGQLLRSEFKDFSTARNLALKAHGTRTKYAVMLDADMSIPAAWRLRVTLQRVALLCALWDQDAMCWQALKMPAFLDGIKFFTIRVFPTAAIGTGAGWHYTYPVHEIPQHVDLPQHVVGDAVMKLLTVDIMTASDPHMRHVARAKKLDLRLLRAEREKRPDDTRVAFYLAQTLHTLDMLPEAVDAYEDRVRMEGWYEEVFESLLRKGKILMALGRDPMRDLFRAAAVSPYRAEPYMVMTWHHAKLSAECDASGWRDSACFLRHRVAALHYAKRASEMPQPKKDLMFVDMSTYTQDAQGAVVEHAFQVAWKTQGAARMGQESASFISSFQGKNPSNTTRAQQLMKKYQDLPVIVPRDNLMWTTKT